MSEVRPETNAALSMKLGIATRALTGQADINYQALRSACAMANDRGQVALFLGDLVMAQCETGGGNPMAPVVDRQAEQKKTCPADYPGDWRRWCWPCRARDTVDRGVSK